MLDLRLIETFIQAARRESFSAAARALGVSPGAVSQNIKALEERLATRLFARTTRQVRLTREGQRFLMRCAPALEALADAATELQEDRAAYRGTLRITSTTAFGRAHVLPAVITFRKLHPELEVELSLSDGFVDIVAEEFDLAIRGGILPDSDYIARLLLPVAMMVVASPTYLDEFGTPETPEALADHALIGMRSNPSQRIFAWEFADDAEVRRQEIEPALVLNDPEAISLAAASGAGIAQLGSNIAIPLIRSGALRHLLQETMIRSRGLYAVYPSKRFSPAKLTSFVEHLTATLADCSDLTWSGRPESLPNG
jgi:DNA-binding transcriptional LysR family regulator